MKKNKFSDRLSRGPSEQPSYTTPVVHEPIQKEEIFGHYPVMEDENSESEIYEHPVNSTVTVSNIENDIQELLNNVRRAIKTHDLNDVVWLQLELQAEILSTLKIIANKLS